MSGDEDRAHIHPNPLRAVAFAEEGDFGRLADRGLASVCTDKVLAVVWSGEG